MAEPFVLTERDEAVGVVTLNRPGALNALSNEVLGQVASALEELDHEDSIRAIVVTGGPQVFAAGADLKQLLDGEARGGFVQTRGSIWDRIRGIGTPLIAAVSGYALGAGCELAMACDLIIASEVARFGQPEINVGIMPGAGGTQRMTRAVGKARAMELVLTGRMMGAYEAERAGLVNRVVPVEVLAEEAMALAREIATKPPISARLAKAAVLKAFDTTLAEGLQHERESMAAVLETEDAREGITAFLEKHRPNYHG